MALFNKLFPGLKANKTTPQNNHEDSRVSPKFPSFSAEHVRLVLFRECDFRGRKLLFDSYATQKVPLEKAEPDKKFVEVCNGYGYLVIAKQNSDYQQLSEMVFGSVAMSFRGTYLKIHSLRSPPRLMFTQVFPSPHSRRQKSSTSSNQSHISTQSSFEHSIKLDDSGANSAYSTSDRLSDRSTASDTVLVCRRLHSIPLDVPVVASSFSKTSLVVDSGCADHSFSSVSTGPLTFPTWESLFSQKDLSSVSSNSIFKRLLRSSSRSLQSGSISLPNSTEVLHKSHHKASKLGLTIVIEIPSEKEKFLTQYFMEHIALLEGLIWRTHRAIEVAYHRPSTFVSLMVDIAQNTSAWLVNLLNAPHVVTNLWQCFSFGCDSYFNVNAFISDLNGDSVSVCRTLRERSTRCAVSDANAGSSDINLSISKPFSVLPVKSRTELFNFNLSKLLKTDLDRSSKKEAVEGDLVAERFLKEFCELLECYDTKDTNFFISTLLTAVLTHHLGWVATVYPSSGTACEDILNLKQPYNALWSQLTDLYGAIGNPVKTAQTVITGSNKNNVISKILNSLTYFIRFGNVERRNINRSSIEEENKIASLVCAKNNCIPQENYKKYEDHLKEMLTPDSPKSGCSSSDLDGAIKKEFNFFPTIATFNLENSTQEGLQGKPSNKSMEQQSSLLKTSKGLSKIKSHTALTALDSDEMPNQSVEPPNNILKASFSKKSSRDLKGILTEGDLTEVSKGCDENQNNDSFSENNGKTITKSLKFGDLSILEKMTDLETNVGVLGTPSDKNDVIFVLGENETLVGLKKEDDTPQKCICENQTGATIASGAKRKISGAKRPSSLTLSKVSYEFSKNQSEIEVKEIEKCPQSNQSLRHCSSSYESLCVEKEEPHVLHSKISPLSNIRAQSEPPQIRKVSPPKYQYSRVKFNLQQYPQVVRNYMKSKNIELEGLSLGEKVFDKFTTVQHNIKLDFSGYESDSEEVEALQTPSNASELEFTPDMGGNIANVSSKEASSSDATSGEKCTSNVLTLVNVPMPKSIVSENPDYTVPYSSTVIKGLVDTYIPDMVLQGTTNSKHNWDSKLKSNLALNTQHSLLDQPVDEALAIVANTDTWEVQIISSHTYVIDKGTNGVRAEMSQLVANMLESLLQMWKLHIPSQYCILHIEQKLQELCVRSKALAQMLLASEFCTIDLLTSALRIEANDVPLLMAVASTHTPEVTRKYGLSFQ